MNRIKLNATESTNSYLKALVGSGKLSDFTVVTAVSQTKGRGQVDSKWDSEPGKNLTFSVLKLYDRLDIKASFLISVCVSLAVYQALSDLGVPKLRIKWPNDILSGTFKIGGILIENSIGGRDIKNSVIGIGLNVNQTNFSKQPKASSLKLLMATDFHLEQILDQIIERLQTSLLRLQQGNRDIMLSEYEHILFKKDIPATFQEPNGPMFNGIINGINHEGKLRVLLDNGKVMEYGLKEVQLHY